MTTPLRVIVIDDEAPAREGLRLRLKREPDVVLLGEFADVAAALSAAREDPPDVVFLDIQMPGLDGFAFVERAHAIGIPAIVFTTAHDEHAVRAFRVRALDYLLKPIDQEQLHEALAHAREHIERQRKGELADRVRALVSDVGAGTDPPRPPALDRLPVRTERGIQFIDASAIDYVDAAGDGVRVHVGRAAYEVRKSMGELLALLDATRFCRIHRSTIVNVARIRELQPYFHGEYVVVLHDGTRLKLSRGYRAAATRLLGIGRA